jgi:altronate hydrolase
MKAVKIHPDDNVAVALENIEKGGQIDVGGNVLSAKTDVCAGHKIALGHIAAGETAVKYGHAIGCAAKDIQKGESVHTHNLKTMLKGLSEYAYRPDLHFIEPKTPACFMGYRRKTGVGIRNEIWIVPTVGCVNNVAKALEAKSQKLIRKNIDGVFAFTHPYGCSQLSGDHENTKSALCGLIRHPNAGGVLVLGLGCENNGIEKMKEKLGDYDPGRVKFLVCQDVEDELVSGLELISGLIDHASDFKREQLPASELAIGLKCGGSDGFSGITANPLVGNLSDRLIAEGGTAILTEVPEMFGAETILMSRCENIEVFNKTVSMINGFKEYYLSNGQAVYENPSPGNHAGGITTLEEKSLGCIQKGGCSNVVDVLEYGQHCIKKGLNLLGSPGNDLVSSSAMAVSGAHRVLFTTGRGTPFGSPVPTVKLSSNTGLWQKKKNWIDFDCGGLLNGISAEELGGRLYEFVISLASGDMLSKNEITGAREFDIFKSGVTL